MNYDLDYIIESLENLKQSLENDTNYAVYWLSETLDFLSNEDYKMALWSFEKYLQVLKTINLAKIQQNSELLREKLVSMEDWADKKE